jgi:hypothetical protein
MNELLELQIKIKENWSTIIEKYNKHIEENFEKFFFVSYFTFFENVKTQEITKIVSPIFNQIFCNTLKTYGIFKNEINGSDYIYKYIPFEGKLTLSLGNSWTGNGYKKTNYHILIKLNINTQGHIESSFCAIVPVDEILSSWSEPKLNSNFSTLKLLNEDYDKILIIKGKLLKKDRYTQPVLL